MRTPTDAVEYIKTRHQFWSSRIQDWAQLAAPTGHFPWPSCKFWLQPARWAGKYLIVRRTCVYHVAYAMMYDYDDTIAHEVVHHYQYLLDPKSEHHGSLFRVMMKHAAGFDGPQTFHSYDVATVKKVSRLIAMTGVEGADLFVRGPRRGKRTR